MTKSKLQIELKSALRSLKGELNHLIYLLDDRNCDISELLDELESQSGTIQSMVELINENHSLLEDENE